MRVIAYLTQDAKLTQLPTRWKAPTPKPEGEIIQEKRADRIYTTIIRWRDGDGWQWRAMETDGVSLWYYAITPGHGGSVLAPRALAAFEVPSGYEYMVEQLIPLAPDSRDRLLRPVGEAEADTAHWRDKMMAAPNAAVEKS